MYVVIWVVTVLDFFVYYGQDQTWPPWCLLVMFSLAMIASALTKPLITPKVPVPLAAVFVWVMFNAFVLIEYKPALFQPASEINQTIMLKNLAATAVLEFFLLSMLFFLCWKKLRGAMGSALFWVGLAHSGSLILDQLVYQIPTGSATIGLLGNRSIGASFAAVWLFYGYQRTSGLWRIFTAAVTVMAILVSSSGISYAAMLAGAGAMIVAMWPKRWWWAVLVGVGGLSVASFVKPQFWTHLSRYDAWVIFWNFWRAHFLPAFGAGVGTFRFWGPASQMQENFMVGKYFMWAHSDWFQFLFEMGTVGLCLAVFAYGFLLNKAWKRPAQLGALVAFGVVALGNYPLHVASFSLFAWFLVFETLEVPVLIKPESTLSAQE
jgi:hypothetical protein